MIDSTQLRPDGGSVGQLTHGGKKIFRGLWRPLAKWNKLQLKATVGAKVFQGQRIVSLCCRVKNTKLLIWSVIGVRALPLWGWASRRRCLRLTHLSVQTPQPWPRPRWLSWRRPPPAHRQKGRIFFFFHVSLNLFSFAYGCGAEQLEDKSRCRKMSRMMT